MFKPRLIRTFAKLLLGVFILPHVLGFLSVARVMAEVEGATYVAIFDFDNKSKVGGSIVSRWATDSIALEMANAGNNFNVVTRQQIDQAMAELDLVHPLNLTAILRVADKLGVSSVVVGEVRQVRMSDKPYQAKVELVVRQLDASTGEPINGAIARGVSTPRDAFNKDDDILINEAINNAAYIAVKRMVDYIIPQATVLNTFGADTVLLNKGAQDGITKGMEMIVTRLGEVIGKLKVVEVSSTDAKAVRVSAIRGIKPEDRAKAIFQLPTVVSSGFGEAASKVSGGMIGSPSKKGGANVVNMVLGLGLLYFLASNFKSGGESPGGAYAEALAYSPAGPPAARINLEKTRFGKVNITQYKVFRSDTGFATPLLTAVPGVPFVEDRDLVGSATVPPLVPGNSYTYYVSLVYTNASAPSDGDGTTNPDNTGGTTRETSPVATGRVTPIRPVILSNMVSPAQNSQDVDLRNVTFSWRSVRGADRYIVEAALDPSFRDVKYRSADVTRSRESDGELVLLEGQNLFSRFPGIGEDTFIYWRVGARNSGDSPGPVKDFATGLRYIYGETNQFKPKEEPPTPPGS